jgi:hypothetical protein
LSLKFGAKIVLAGAILLGSILTIIIPFAARWSYGALVACRFLTGVAHVIIILEIENSKLYIFINIIM